MSRNARKLPTSSGAHPAGCLAGLRARFGARLLAALRSHSAFQAIPYWIGAALTGAVAVGYAEAFKHIESFSQSLFASRPASFLVLTPLCFLLGWGLIHRFAPDAAGSGLPQVMAANRLTPGEEHGRVESILAFKTSLIKMLSSSLCLLGGGVVGREGPTIQIASSLFYQVGSRFRRVWPAMSHQSWIVAGGAAGIASAFNTPLGGIVFAIEELSNTHFGQFRAVLIQAVIVSGLVSQWMAGPYLHFGFPKLRAVGIDFLPVALFVGLLAGTAGGAFGKALFSLSRWRGRARSARSLAAISLTCGISLAALAWAIGPMSLGAGSSLVNHLLFQPGAVADWTWVLGRVGGGLLSYLAGGAGGIFAPSLAAGASIGSQLAGWTRPEDSNLMVLLGMIGFLTGVTRAPFTAFVLVLEMTDRHSAIFFMMAAGLAAHAGARLVDRRGFYEKQMDRLLGVSSEGTRVP